MNTIRVFNILGLILVAALAGLVFYKEYQASQSNATTPQTTPIANINGQLQLNSHPQGAVVATTEGDFLGVTPIDISLTPESYQLVLKKTNYQNLMVDVTIVSQQLTKLDVALKPTEIKLTPP